VQLADDRVLLLWLPHYTHTQGKTDGFNGSVIHAQICEYQSGNPGKYVCGPIVNVALQASHFSDFVYSMWSKPNSSSAFQSSVKAIALSATTVALVIRVNNTTPFLYVLRIPQNTNYVDTSAVGYLQLSDSTILNGTTSYAFDIAPYPSDATKMVMQAIDGTNNYLLLFNVPSTGNPSLVHRTTITNNIATSVYGGTICNISKTTAAGVDPVFSVTGATSATAIDSQLYKCGSTAFSGVGNKLTINTGFTTAIRSIKAKCVSSDNTPNAIIAITDASNNVFYGRMSSSDGAAFTLASTTLNVGIASRGIYDAWNWGNNRVVFVGEYQTLLCVDNVGTSGTATSLITSVESTDTSRSQIQWYPFNSRPIYTYYNVAVGAICQYYSRTGHTTTNVSTGSKETLYNYFPWGHDYGLSSVWNEAANCLVVFKGGKIYHLDNTGTILDECDFNRLVPDLVSSNWYKNINQIVCSPNGRYTIFHSPYFGYSPTTGTGKAQIWSIFNGSINQPSYFISTNNILNSTDLSIKAMSIVPDMTTSTYNGIIGHAILDPSNQDRVLILTPSFGSTGNGSFPRILVYDTTNNTLLVDTTFTWPGQNNTGNNTYAYGYRFNGRIVPDVVNNVNKFRIIGSHIDPSQQLQTKYYITSVAYDINSLANLNLDTQLDTSTPAITGYNYGVASHQSTKQFAAFIPQISSTIIGAQTDKGLLYTSLYGDLFQHNYGLIIDTTYKKFATIKCSKYGILLALQSTRTGTQSYPTFYAFNTVNPSIARRTFTAATGSGWVSCKASKIDLSAYVSGSTYTYSVNGPDDTVKFSVALGDQANSTFFYITNPAGQSINTSIPYRSKDTYLIPAGYSLRIKSDTAGAISSMVTIVEDN
jgi:hypothetical protein